MDWSETALMESEFAAEDAATLSAVVARLGVADVRTFGLTWADYPLRLQRALAAAADPAALASHLRLEGRWALEDQRESSHWFLFGHRYWPDVRAAVQLAAATPLAPGSLDLAAQVQAIAREVARQRDIDVSWVVGITAIALRTLHRWGSRTPPRSRPPGGR